jgi:thioredoxin 1
VSPIVTVTDADFAGVVLANPKPVVVDFWAVWCGPCKQIAPILEEIAREHDSVVIAKLNVDENPVTAAEARITSIPTLNVYQGGVVVKQIIGARPKKALVQDLAAYLS